MAITRLNPVTVTETWSTQDGNVSASKYGNVVSVNAILPNTKNTTASTWYLLGTLPSGWRPSENFQLSVISTSGNGKTGILSVGTDGKVQVYNSEGTGTTYRGAVSFCT